MTDLSQLDFDQTYRRLFPMILSKCHRMTPDTAEAQDLAQEVFVRLWRSRATIADPQALVSWLYRTCTRLAIDRSRGRGRRDQAFALLAAEQAEGAGPADPERQSAVRRALADVAGQVSERELEVVLLCRLDGLNQVEVADVLGIGERTVRRLLGRFDERLEPIRRLREEGIA